MTVRELINKLQKADPDVIVCTLGIGCAFSDAKEIIDVFQVINSSEEENNGYYILS